MPKIVDNLIAFRILYMLVTPFEKSEAYKLGIIDKDGNQLKKMRDLKTVDEKDAYNYLTKLVFTLKKLISKLPAGKSQFASFVAAYWLVKESYQNKAVITEQDFMKTIESIENGITLVEEEIEIEKFLTMLEDGGAGGGAAGGIANVTGAAVATDKAAVRLNKKNKPVSGILGTPNYMIRRKKSIQMGQ